MPKVSVIVPVYNQKEEYLRVCLDSIISQTLEDIEVLCINDGSTNNSRDVIDEYRALDTRVKLLEHDNGENKGLSASRNLAINYASGDFISFVDSDDAIDKHFLKDLYEIAIEHKVDIAAADIYAFRTNDSIRIKSLTRLTRHDKTIKVGFSAKEKYQLAQMPKHNYVWNKLYRRDKLVKSGVLFEEGRLYEDIDWSHKVVYYLNGLAITDSTHYLYRQNDDSIVSNKSEKWLKDRSIAHRKTIDFLQSLPHDFGNMRDYDWTKMKTHKLFGITLMHIRTCGLYKLYYLFGKWLVYEIYEKRNEHE